MSRYTGPKARINRALGIQIFESRGAVKALERRPQPPGMHTRRGKQSTYGLALREKQKIKYFYGLTEKQLRRFYASACRQVGNTAEALMVLCERRLDNVVRLGGLAHSRPQARQGINHGHFRVNGRKVDIPSYLVKPGDVVTVCDRPNVQAFYRMLVTEPTAPPRTWLQADLKVLTITIGSLPSIGDLSLEVDVAKVIELMSR